MKKYTGIAIILLLSSCYLYKSVDIVDLTSMQEVNEYIYDTIAYTEDAEKDYCQSPIETLDVKTGDCEDMSILFLYLCYKNIGIKADLAIIDVGNNLHTIVKYNNIYYDPTLGYSYTSLIETEKEIVVFGYNIAMLYATNIYTKNL